MTTEHVLTELRQRILAGCPLILLETFEELRWERELAQLAHEMERGLVVWTAASGPTVSPPASRNQIRSPRQFLRRVKEYPAGQIFLLKDLHPYLERPEIVRQLRDLVPQLPLQQHTILLMSPTDLIPLELVKDVTVMPLPLPRLGELQEVLQSVLDDPDAGIEVVPDPKERERLAQAVLGLTAAEAQRAFVHALRERDGVDESVIADLVAQKRHMVQGSALLEFFDLEEGLDDVGGLEQLKEWIAQRAEGFSEDARARGIAYPKGVLLTGVQGCGKSLCAKAIARRFGFPLVRLDVANLLESTRGTSEQNLRDVLHLMEAIAPSVLWLEEIDKAFAGFSEEATQDATMARMVGRFLTWLQEHESPVFVVATANNVRQLPPELVRRGRFDELFFVDLPNFYERKAIFAIHLKKRGWKPEKFDVDRLANATDGYSGAEIEQIVNSAVIDSYSRQRVLTLEDLLESAERTVPLSVTMEDEIFHLREWARTRARPATPEYRVMQVMDEEERRGEVPLPEERPQPKWLELAEFGQLGPAIVEYVRLHDFVTWSQLVHDLEPYAEVRGNCGLVLRSNPKVVLWTRISQEFADLVADLVERKRMYLHVAEVVSYAAAQRPQLAIVSAVPQEPVAQPVWIPTVFRLLPPVGGSRQFARVARIRLAKKSS